MHAYNALRHIRRVNAIGKDHKKIVTGIARQLVAVKDEKGKPTKKEFLYYWGSFQVTDHRGQEYGAEFEIGKYQKPRIVANSNQKYSPETGQPLHNEKMLSGVETIYTIEVPKTKEARKKLLDSIIGDDNYPDSIQYYYMELSHGNIRNKRDATFTYDDFVSYSIEELKHMSDKAGGSKGSNFFRDKDNNIRTRDGTLVSKGN